jgi:DNA-binding response OmpR family regulator
MGRVLILEPDAEIRELLRRVVAQRGHEPLAPERVPARPPPDLDALVLEPAWAEELARALRERDGNLPVVFTALDPASAARFELRPLRYLLKPYSLRDLEEAIAAALER